MADQYLGSFSLFNVDLKRHNCPSVQRASTADDISRGGASVHCNGRSVFDSRFVKFVVLIIGTKICCVFIVTFHNVLFFMYLCL